MPPPAARIQWAWRRDARRLDIQRDLGAVDDPAKRGTDGSAVDEIHLPVEQGLVERPGERAEHRERQRTIAFEDEIEVGPRLRLAAGPTAERVDPDPRGQMSSKNAANLRCL